MGRLSAVARQEWTDIEAIACELHSSHSRTDLWRWELILSRLSAQLASRLAPLLWAPGWPQPTSLAPPPGAAAVDSWFDLMLVCHHIIGLGRAAFEGAMQEPARAIAAVSDGGIWPDALLAPGGKGAWCVVSAAEAEVRLPWTCPTVPPASVYAGWTH